MKENNIKEVIRKYLKEVLFKNETRRLAIVFTLVNAFILIIDIINVPSKLIKEYNNNGIFIVIAISLFIISTITFLDKHLLDLVLKIKYVNTLDRILFISLICTIVSILLILYLKIGSTYKYIILVISIALLLFLLIYRINKCKPQKSCNNKQTKNFLDLKDIFYNKIPKNEGLILISDKGVEYDLFERSSIINQLYRSIVQCTNCNDSFVIGLEGEWGSGKTTILNNLKNEFSKNNKDITIVDNFDLWTYETQEALLLAMFQVILDKSNIKCNIIFGKEIINTIISLIGSDKKIGAMIKSLLFKENLNNDVSKIKEQISEHLRKHNISIVFFIDNIDRANANNIIFLFKIINTILDIDNITYVLSYDKARIGRILENTLEIDPHFTEKIIQQEVKVPKLTFNGPNDVLKVCANNLLLSYGIYEKDICKYESAIKCMLKNISNIRSFKIIVNSVFSNVFTSNDLNKPDLFALELVKFFDYNLYESILVNKAYFISYDNIYDSKIFSENNYHIPNSDEKKSFYDNLFKDKDKLLIELLSDVFIYVKKYLDGKTIELQHGSHDPLYADVALNSRPASAKYFDLYFNRTANEYLDISISFKRTMEELNGKSTKEIYDYLTKIILELKEESQRQWLESLHLYKNQIDNKFTYPIILVLLKNIGKLNSMAEAFITSPKSRAVMIICDLICNLNLNEKKEFLSEIKKSYYYLFVLIGIIKSEIIEKEFSEKSKEVLKAICNDILTNSINIYDNEFYEKNNIFAFYEGLKMLENVNADIEIKKYVSDIIAPNNIYRILADAITINYGNMSYYYTLDKRYMDILFANTDIINSLLDSNPAETEAEKFIVKLYNKFNSKDAISIKTISEKPIEFNL